MKNLFVLLSIPILLIGLQSHAACSEETQQISENDFKAELLHFRPGQNPSRTILIFPPTGRTNYIDKSYARTFCDEGYNAVIMSQWSQDEGDDGDLGSHQRYYERAQRVLRMVLAQTKTPFVGLLGTSLGGLFASMGASLYPQINATFVIVAGAPISSVIAYSDQTPLMELYNRRQAEFGFKNRAEYAAALKQRIQYEPLSMPRPVPTMHLGMVIAEDDTVVPTDFQKTLADFWKPQTLISVSGGHMYSIIKTWLLHSSKIVDFFNRSSAPRQ